MGLPRQDGVQCVLSPADRDALGAKSRAMMSKAESFDDCAILRLAGSTRRRYAAVVNDQPVIDIVDRSAAEFDAGMNGRALRISAQKGSRTTWNGAARRAMSTQQTSACSPPC